MPNPLHVFTPMPWAIQAACKGKPTAWWYSDTPDHQRTALAICRGCPVKDECADAGRTRGEEGIWGGELHIDRGRRRIHHDTVQLEHLICHHCKKAFTRPANTQGKRLYCDRTCAKYASAARRKPFKDQTTRLFDRLRAEVTL